MPIMQQSREGKTRKPGTKCLEDILDVNEDPSFINFIEVSLLLSLNHLCSNVYNGTQKRE
jgi:hypothetical protein